MTHSNGFGDIYHIIWFLPSTKGVGEVRNYASDLRRYRRIGVSLGDDLLKKMNMRFLMTEWTTTGPKIRVSTAFMTIPRSLREAGIWHEVGHIHHGHHSYEEVRSQTGVGTSPEMATGDGTVQALEETADRFAVLQSSKEALKGFLEYLLRARSSAGSKGWNETERRELQTRIASIWTY
jgi:hypothetical protein